jgi:hypothetical protein
MIIVKLKKPKKRILLHAIPSVDIVINVQNKYYKFVYK